MKKDLQDEKGIEEKVEFERRRLGMPETEKISSVRIYENRAQPLSQSQQVTQQSLTLKHGGAFQKKATAIGVKANVYLESFPGGEDWKQRHLVLTPRWGQARDGACQGARNADIKS